MSGAPLDLVLCQARLADDGDGTVDIGIANGVIEAIAPRIDSTAAALSLAGRLVVAGLVETHIHLDKSCLLDRCGDTGTLAEAITAVGAAKRDFSVEDVYSRAAKTLERAIGQGTMRMRTHVEVDPRVGLRAFEAISQLKRDYAWAIDLQICVFPQEGLTNDPGCEALLVQACERGADVIGGCPYTDTDANEQIARIFAIAERFDLDIDFHLDFDLDGTRMDLVEVCRQTVAHRRGGRVAVGHVSKLSAVSPARLIELAHMMRDAGVALTVLPSTDLFLMGRDAEQLVPRGVAPAYRLLEQGVTCSISTNNVLNPFTPFGDCSLVRMANLYANVAQLGRPAEMARCLEMVTTLSARLMNVADYGIAVGAPADIVVLDAESPAQAIAELSPPLFGFKRGRRSFTRAATELHRP